MRAHSYVLAMDRTSQMSFCLGLQKSGMLKQRQMVLANFVPAELRVSRCLTPSGDLISTCRRTIAHFLTFDREEVGQSSLFLLQQYQKPAPQPVLVESSLSSSCKKKSSYGSLYLIWISRIASIA